MSTSQAIDKLCVLAAVIALLISILFMNGSALGIQSKTSTMGYEDRLFDASRVHTIDIVIDDWDTFLETAGSEAYTELYHQYFREFLDTVDAAEIITQAKERIAPYVEKDPTKFCTYEEFEKGVETLTAFCDLRSQSVAQQLAGEEADVDAASLNLSDMGTMGKGFGGKDRQPGNQNTGNDTQTQRPSDNAPGQMPGNQNPMGFPEGMETPEGMGGRFPGQDGHREQTDINGTQGMAQWTLLIIAFAVMAAGLLFAYKFRR